MVQRENIYIGSDSRGTMTDTFVNPSTAFVGSGGFFSGAAILGPLAIGRQS